MGDQGRCDFVVHFANPYVNDFSKMNNWSSMIRFRHLLLPLQLNWSAGIPCHAAQVASFWLVPQLCYSVTPWSFSPGCSWGQVPNFPLLWGRNLGRQRNIGTSLLLEMTNVTSKIRTSLEESMFISYHLSLRSPLWGWGHSESLSMSLQPLEMSSAYPVFTV